MDKLQQGTHSGSYVLRSKKRETTISKTRKFVVLQICLLLSKKRTKTSTRISATWISAKRWSRCAPAPRLLPCRGGGEQCAMLSQCCDPNGAPTWNITSTAEFSSRSSHQLTAFFVEIGTPNYAQKVMHKNPPACPWHHGPTQLLPSASVSRSQVSWV